MTQRQLSSVDHLIVSLDQTLRTLLPGAARAERASPAAGADETALSERERRHTAGLMRINHTGEVCAQALYQGQALTARKPGVRNAMDQAAREETDHLAWCDQRLRELGDRTSLLNPIFYGTSFALGAIAGAISDRISLGFVAATEEQVCQHIEHHLQSLPEHEQKSRAVLQQMLVDEKHHGTKALEAGGVDFPRWVKRAMTQMSRVMTNSTYYV
ncbi:MAG: 2-polyprenyl-3-methyl-6-methoxy-1,4-benzoquinone monooxygenase [Spongiibacteraceae bacterium]